MELILQTHSGFSLQVIYLHLLFKLEITLNVTKNQAIPHEYQEMVARDDEKTDNFSTKMSNEEKFRIFIRNKKNTKSVSQSN